MKKYDWQYDDDEYIEDSIRLVESVIEATKIDPTLTEIGKQKVIDNCLDKLNSLYNEQRKRGTFKGDSGTT